MGWDGMGWDSEGGVRDQKSKCGRSGREFSLIVAYLLVLPSMLIFTLVF